MAFGAFNLGNPAGPVMSQDPFDLPRQWDDGEIGERRGMLIESLGKAVLFLDTAAHAGSGS